MHLSEPHLASQAFHRAKRSIIPSHHIPSDPLSHPSALVHIIAPDPLYTACSDHPSKTLRQQNPSQMKCLRLTLLSIRLDTPERRPRTPHPFLQPAPPGLQQMSQPLPPGICRFNTGPRSILGRKQTMLMRIAYTKSVNAGNQRDKKFKAHAVIAAMATATPAPSTALSTVFSNTTLFIPFVSISTSLSMIPWDVAMKPGYLLMTLPSHPMLT